MIEFMSEHWWELGLAGLALIFFVIIPLLDWWFGILDDPKPRMTKDETDGQETKLQS